MGKKIINHESPKKATSQFMALNLTKKDKLNVS